MDIKTRHIGAYGGFPAKIIELTVSNNTSSITEDITLLDNSVDLSFIDALKDLVYELEEHNQKVMEARND